MEQNKQQTAVWWLAEQLFKDTAPTLRQRVAIEEARAMEKEQHYNTYKAGASLALMSMKGLNGMSFEQYYKETYGK